ncbi:hypothetical protein B0F90DRAFT_1718843 [Multifurca ochricompacta]|uniref:Alpha/beta hydrolase fold-3 domain-containing protein n=1 Tax=Multifurca ochricompacta TaxID=376703 RepID=A0AAD4QNT7_9AGAM|nr:hypothetical protein B0F90DRAFT_1718843 [Multifurca ochricompacta]
MYDKTPVYPHQQHLPWAHEPWKSFYVFQRLLTTILLVPLWAAYYSILPLSFRPRSSWSITQIIVVKFTKRIYKVTEVAGVTWGTRDPTQEPVEKSLKETRFAWVPPLPDELCTGVVNDDQVPSQKVGTYIWPKALPPNVRMRMRCTRRGGGDNAPEKDHQEKHTPNNVLTVTSQSDEALTDIISATSTPASNFKLPKVDLQVVEPLHYNGDSTCNLDVEADAADSYPPMIGIYLHGGGYCHMSAHENSGTSRIPRRLMKDKLFQEIHAVEYRLLQHSPVPGALQDAAAVYAHLVTHHLGARKGSDGKYHYPHPPITYHTHTDDSPTRQDASSPTFTPSIGLALDNETRLDNFANLPRTLTSSPVAETEHRQHHSCSDSVDPVISGNDAIPHSPAHSIHSSRTNTHPIASAYRPRIILIGDSAGGNLVLALARWIRDQGVLPAPDGMLLLSPSCDPSHTLPQVPASRRPRPHADTDYLLDTPEPRALLSRTFLGHHPIEMVYSPYVSPASEWVLSVFHGEEGMVDLEPLGPHKDSRDYRDEGIKTYDCAVNGSPTFSDGRTAASNPFIRVPPGMGLFTEFPRALVVVGDAERLEREVVALERALEHDGVRVRMVWAKDAVHDILIMGAWDERVREGIWKEIDKWVREIATE